MHKLTSQKVKNYHRQNANRGVNSLPKIQKVEPFNKKEESKGASGVYDIDPTRYGDWQRNGRCIDF
jgi:hypothetical protein